MKRVYPVFIKKSGDDYLVFLPDFKLYTEGKNELDAINMARDAIALYGPDMEKSLLPEPSDSERAYAIAKEDADEDFDYSDGMLTFVDVDFDAYAKKLENKTVRKSCTIPYWLNIKAEAMGLNFSKILQDALKERVGVL